MNGVSVPGQLFRYGCGGLLAISASGTRWIIGYLHFDDVVPIKGSERYCRAKMSRAIW